VDGWLLERGRHCGSGGHHDHGGTASGRPYGVTDIHADPQAVFDELVAAGIDASLTSPGDTLVPPGSGTASPPVFSG
jgi:hypothetical protein